MPPLMLELLHEGVLVLCMNAIAVSKAIAEEEGSGIERRINPSIRLTTLRYSICLPLSEIRSPVFAIRGPITVLPPTTYGCDRGRSRGSRSARRFRCSPFGG